MTVSHPSDDQRPPFACDPQWPHRLGFEHDLAFAPFVSSVHRDRLARAAVEASERGVDALLITPSSDYGYLLGYAAPALERLTCLIVPADGAPTLVLPRLEEPLARHQLGDLADRLGDRGLGRDG